MSATDDTEPGFPPPRKPKLEPGSYAQVIADERSRLRATTLPPPHKPMGNAKKGGIVAIALTVLTALSQVPWDQVLAFLTHFVGAD